MVVPGYAEVGAKAGAAASKADLAEVKQALETDVTTAAYVSESEIAVMDGASDIGITDYPTTGYYA